MRNRYPLPSSASCPWLTRYWFVVSSLLLLGCSDARTLGTVAGTVRYRDTAVPEGIVSLYSPELGVGKESQLEADGTFVVRGLPFGPYQIAIHPPLKRDDFGGTTMPSFEPKKVDNIPAAYRNPSTSRFTCTVDAPTVEITLQME